MHLWFLCWQKWCLYTLYLRYPIWWLTCSKHRFYNVSLSQSPDRWKIRNSTQTQDFRIKKNWRLIQFYWWSKTKSVQIGCQPGAFTGLWDQLKHQAYKTLGMFYLDSPSYDKQHFRQHNVKWKSKYRARMNKREWPDFTKDAKQMKVSSKIQIPN